MKGESAWKEVRYLWEKLFQYPIAVLPAFLFPNSITQCCYVGLLLCSRNQVGDFPFSGCCAPARQKGSQDEGRQEALHPARTLGTFSSVKMIDDLWVKTKWVPRPASLRRLEWMWGSSWLDEQRSPWPWHVLWLIALWGWIVPEQFLQDLRYKQVFLVIC